ncbi:MAG TPA: response regulator [Candidatus Nitrosotenuis sp.]|nr:response regulator [Candidatus Nitrosotenuis sp.]
MKSLKRILYVEDDQDISSIAKFTLETIGGFEVDICHSGKEVFEKISEFKPQLILLDVMMPDMDGPTTLRKLRALPEGKDIPVVFVTARIQSHQIEEYQEFGALGTIAKPFDPLTLSTEIEKLWMSYAGRF